MKEYAIIGEQVTKCYQMYSGQSERLKGFFFGGKGKPFYALKGLTFQIEEGDSVGLIGLNGSGKSTLANILAGISRPSSGSLTINGEPSLIAISSGLNMFLTGMENITLKGLMIGLTMQEIDAIRQDVVEFADIGEFIHQPVKMYSSGMKARLGFAISVNINPDIMIIDEALSVGDPTFTQRCLDKMNSFRREGKTIIFVSHGMNQVRDFCNKAMWLEYGMQKAFGPTEEVIPMYEHFLKTYNAMSAQEQKEYKKRICKNQSHLLVEG